jgi:hypothetical protein
MEYLSVLERVLIDADAAVKGGSAGHTGEKPTTA